ncbi:hypothetical protein J6TS7_16020 [Paenibacillus dendritiformis]|nr:hypothetical protein J6TS7_16020 [Paenibacillus dendritiformis]
MQVVKNLLADVDDRGYIDEIEIRALEVEARFKQLPEESKFLEIANYLRNDDFESAKKLYKELGGELKPPPIKKMTKYEKENGIDILHLMDIYLKLGRGESAEDLKMWADLMREYRVGGFLDEDSEKFKEAANLVELDKYDEVKKILDELLPKYIADEDREAFEKLIECKTASEKIKAMEKLVKPD